MSHVYIIVLQWVSAHRQQLQLVSSIGVESVVCYDNNEAQNCSLKSQKNSLINVSMLN